MLAQQDRSTTPLHLVSEAVSTSPGDQVPRAAQCQGRVDIKTLATAG